MKLLYKVEKVKDRIKKELPVLQEHPAIQDHTSSSQEPVSVYQQGQLEDKNYIEAAANTTPSPSPIKIYTPSQITTIDRRYVSDASVFKETQAAVRAALEQSPDKSEREERQRIVEEYVQRERVKGFQYELSEKAGEANYTRRIVDIKGNPIGTVIADDNSNGYVVIGDYRYVRDASFDITMAKSEAYCVRTSVYFTEQGYDCIQRFVENLLLRRCGDLRPRGGIDGYIKQQMKLRNTFNTTIDGLNIHVSLRGRIQLFSVFAGLENMLVDSQGLDDREIRRFRANTHSATIKKWVYETTPEFNSFVGELFREISSVVTTVLTY